MTSFIDRVTIHVTAGNGGNGCASVHREKFKPLGGPDGGNGGDGADVVLTVNPQTTTLLNYHHNRHRKAENGTQGMGGMRDGKKGVNLVLPVPNGTVVKSVDGEILADLTGTDVSYVVAQGGKGGLGNAALATKKRKAPGFALLGEPGDELDVVLELKSVADVALVGFPSAGKSSIIAAMSSARPKIADYPFTTLVPNLGVVSAGDMRFTMADVPGLIPGASQGKGLGLDFLRHIERCSVIVHVLDCATLEVDREPLKDLDIIEDELRQYESELDQHSGRTPLMSRPRIIVLNKTDIPDGEELAEMVIEDIKKRGFEVYQVSAVSHKGLKQLAFRLGELVKELRVEEELEPTRIILKPKPVDNAQTYTITKVNYDGEDAYQIRGSKPERWVKQTDFTNEEAIGFLADRLHRIGIEDELVKIGARAGDTVVIGDLEKGVVFDWEPTMQTGAELLGARGTDSRFEESSRPTRREKRERYHDMMDAKAAAREELQREKEEGIWTSPNR